MKARLLTGVVLGTAVICLITLTAPWATYLLLQLVVLLCAHEFYTITLDETDKPQLWFGVLICGAFVAVVWFQPRWLPVMLLAGIMGSLAMALFSRGEVQAMGRRAVGLLSGYCYVGVLFGACTAIVAFGDRGPLLFLTLLGGVFFGDTGAYFAGKLFGNKKLYPKISPKKTWMGSFGGLAASIGGIFLFSHLTDLEFAAVDCVILGAGIAVLEQIGDLVESLFKRAHDVKDSGTILPGHGGMLDRVDGVLFAGSFMWVWLNYLQ